MTRPKGEGSLYEYRQGWRAYVTVKGKRRYFYFPNVTESEAAAALREKLNQRDDGTLPKGKDLTLGAWMRHWVQTAKLRPQTQYNYHRNIERYVIPNIGDIKLSELEPEDLEGLYLQMSSGALSMPTKHKTEVDKHGKPLLVKKPLSGSAILSVHRNIRRALNVALKRQRVARNVALSVELDLEGRPEMKTMSSADAQRVLAKANADGDGARWYLGVVYGIRPSEVLGLEWTNVDLDNKIVSIRQQVHRVVGKGVVISRYTKTDAGRRDIPIPEPLVKMLRRRRAIQMEQRIELGNSYVEWEFEEQPTSLVFTQANGKPIDIKVDTRQWKKLLTDAGLPDERRYIARHTAASMMIEMGMPVEVVSNLLGHKKTSFTYDTYVHPMQDAKRAAADKLGAMFG